jgi:enamine deaminase RidA (YjgF/YER057c/UK114 family)
MDVYAKLKELNLTLPEPSPKGGIYKTIVQVGNCLYIAGQGTWKNGVVASAGKIGSELSIEEGFEAARLCALNALRHLHDYLGDLNKIKRIVKTLGFVQSADGFTQQPKVINGASSLIHEIWGDDGLGARSAIGVNELPNNYSVEIEFIFEVKED